ncbi:MbtH family protein [Streptomyces sp. H39-S7]|uniref:MbtH family protein n=1 Tax=Streptomyces sp. H39-S7 TaxID=3004357 RepID=UPI0022B05D69|nr:MbtH family protein [Streptomyces sp. H39-S7]MCZ4123090.1 MbtH family protein [Streptomyces sp. H39-S7]
MTRHSPFDADPDAARAGEPTHLVLRNAAGEYSLWPAFAPVPGGWIQVYGPDSHDRCSAYVEEYWTMAL